MSHSLAVAFPWYPCAVTTMSPLHVGPVRRSLDPLLALLRSIPDAPHHLHPQPPRGLDLQLFTKHIRHLSRGLTEAQQ